MNHQVPFKQVDVFTNIPFMGNPVAVVLNGNELSTEQMQAIANWMNLSETTFVCTPSDPQADYRLHIFTPRSELPFAGHPTIGSAFAVLEHGLKPKAAGRLVQECGRGLVSIHIYEDKLFFELPEPKVESIQSVDVAELASALGVDPNSIKASAIIDVGAVWITLQLSNAGEVRNLRPDMAKFSALIPPGITGVTVFGIIPDNPESDIEVRSFAPNMGINEDPVCGSGNGCVATLVKELGLIGKPKYVASQGQCVGRNGRVEVRFADNGKILIGGQAVTCIEGAMKI
ncbi:MAG: PhzF family phenazine biosynthesis protein [Peptococcaceae bacterium MAG4]|jgi:PhzF family phenazine biosynthesis protein|nr:PhzF family phenazine biosynthesis protein [Peptococcaceae bacterium MAG4]NLW39187.1 PhzF family phenazine biosynthesis protein [Peptococcaceae bacterium]